MLQSEILNTINLWLEILPTKNYQKWQKNK